MSGPPFVVGKPVVGEYFVDREEEMRRLLDLTEGVEKGASSNTVLIGLRRTGKTSILGKLGNLSSTQQANNSRFG
jgi:predicted AAA+ superfamily ATPase